MRRFKIIQIGLVIALIVSMLSPATWVVFADEGTTADPEPAEETAADTGGGSDSGDSDSGGGDAADSGGGGSDSGDSDSGGGDTAASGGGGSDSGGSDSGGGDAAASGGGGSDSGDADSGGDAADSDGGDSGSGDSDSESGDAAASGGGGSDSGDADSGGDAAASDGGGSDSEESGEPKEDSEGEEADGEEAQEPAEPEGEEAGGEETEEPKGEEAEAAESETPDAEETEQPEGSDEEEPEGEETQAAAGETREAEKTEEPQATEEPEPTEEPQGSEETEEPEGDETEAAAGETPEVEETEEPQGSEETEEPEGEETEAAESETPEAEETGEPEGEACTCEEGAEECDCSQEGESVADVVQSMDENDVELVDEDGEAVPLASQEAEEALSASDPYFTANDDPNEVVGYSSGATCHTSVTDCNNNVANPIRAAIADDRSTGTTINVEADTYNEQITINKTLNLVGVPDKDGNNPIIQAPEGLDNDDNDDNDNEAYIVTISGNHVVTFEQFTVIGHGISGTDPNGILVTNDAQATVTNNEVTETKKGITVDDSAGTTTVTNNDINNNAVGMEVFGADDEHDAEDTTVEDNTFENNTHQVEVDDPDTNVDEFIDDALEKNDFDKAVTVDHPGNSYAPPVIFSAIQDAINEAEAGDTVNVAPGTYGEAIDINKPLALLGAGPDQTVINGEAKIGGTKVHVEVLGDLTINGFTIDASDSTSWTTIIGVGEMSDDPNNPGQWTFTNNIFEMGTIYFDHTDADITINNNTFNTMWSAIGWENHRGEMEIGYNTMTFNDVNEWQTPGIINSCYAPE